MDIELIAVQNLKPDNSCWSLKKECRLANGAVIVPKEILWKGLLHDLNIALWPYLIGL